MNDHEKYMKRCLELAEKGQGYVAPNPMVGCVIVKNNIIVSEGWHRQYGGPHAEVNAINKLPADFDFSDCTVYVNLEPCSHFGKTPPCSTLLIEKKVKRVIIANLDTNPLVAGKGIERLQKAGIEVITGILEKEARQLNIRFFTFHEKKRPYIILKWAQTADGFISRWPLPENKEDNWITSPESKKLTHQWRAQEQAILVGANTVINDDPELTTRLIEGNNPARVYFDKDLSVSRTKRVFTANASVFIFNELKNENENHLHFLKIPFDADLVKHALSKLYENKIQSVIVEGGTKTLESFIQSGFWDEARVFVGNKKFQSGIKAPKFDLNNIDFIDASGDKLYLIQNKY